MAIDRISNEDLLRLNALVDGELPPAEHAALAARIAADRDLAHGHAALARLKASLVEDIDNTPAPVVRWLGARGGPRTWRRVAAAAAGAAILGLAIIGAALDWRGARDEPAARPEAAIVLAALPSTPVIPDLAAGGLTLVGTEVEQIAGVSVLVAAYRGPRGCRLELRVHPAALKLPPTAGTNRRAWTVGELGYELAAFGMPEVRFAIIAGAAERQSQAGSPQPDRLREARAAAPPCLG
jgi:anti-sigma factor RsiW